MGKIVVEAEWLKLALNVLGVISIAVVAYVNNRVTRMEDGMKAGTKDLNTRMTDIETETRRSVAAVSTRLGEVEAAARQHAESGDNALWTMFNEHARETREFRERVLTEGATKADLAGVKNDLKEHISTSVNAAVNALKASH